MREEDKLYQAAKKKVAKKKGFYKHLQAYVVVNVFILFMNGLYGNLWDAAGLPLAWGMGLAMHYFSVFGMPGGKMTDEWEDREIEKEMSKMRGKKPRRSDIDERLDLRELDQRYEDKDFV